MCLPFHHTGNIRLNKIRPFHLATVLTALAKDGYSGRSVNLYLITIRGVLKAARRQPDSVWLFPSPQRGDRDIHALSFRESLLLPVNHYQRKHGVSRTTLWRWEGLGLRILHVGAKRFIRPSDWTTFIESQHDRQQQEAR